MQDQLSPPRRTCFVAPTERNSAEARNEAREKNQSMSEGSEKTWCGQTSSALETMVTGPRKPLGDSRLLSKTWLCNQAPCYPNRPVLPMPKAANFQ